ncbi:hypothetical protein BDZ91DRAFT_394750 [Kalaharituber pfeilii]|nr:hypothetical protein BDZ91DRAFT_394750 [Kalaharituber pfeilii]
MMWFSLYRNSFFWNGTHLHNSISPAYAQLRSIQFANISLSQLTTLNFTAPTGNVTRPSIATQSDSGAEGRISPTFGMWWLTSILTWVTAVGLGALFL